MEVGGSDDFFEAFESLKADRKKQGLANKIQDTIDLLHAGILPGDQVRTRQIPAYYAHTYNVEMLYRVAMPLSRRLLYAVFNPEDTVRRYAFMLDVIDHKLYNKRFGYFKKR